MEDNHSSYSRPPLFRFGITCERRIFQGEAPICPSKRDKNTSPNSAQMLSNCLTQPHMSSSILRMDEVEKTRSADNNRYSKSTPHKISPNAIVNYIPPGLSCGAEFPDNKPAVYALGRFGVGHVWGPYLIHLSPEFRQRLKSLDDCSPNLTCTVAVKNTGDNIDVSTVVLGEEHTWIKLLYETGLRSKNSDSNVDLLLDPCKSPLPANGGGPLAQHSASGSVANLKSFSSPMQDLSTNASPGPIVTPKRDKKCSYCGISFSNLDTLSAHMTHYCSRRPQIACVSTNESSPPLNSPGVSETGSTVSKSGPITSPGSRPNLNRHSNTRASHVAVPVVGLPSVSTYCPSNHLFPIGQTSNPKLTAVPLLDSLHDENGTPNLYGVQEPPKAPAGPFSPDAVNSLRSSLTAALLPYAAGLLPTSGLSLPTIPRVTPPLLPTTAANFISTFLPRSTSASASPPISKTVLPESSIPLALDMQSQTSSITSSVSLRNALPSNAPEVLNGLLNTPIYCSECQRFFASQYLYTCHLQMSCRLLNMKENEGTGSRRTDGDIARLTPSELSVAAMNLGLVLAAPLVTNNGLQYVPVHPECGLIVQNPKTTVSNCIPAAPVIVDSATNSTTGAPTVKNAWTKGCPNQEDFDRSTAGNQKNLSAVLDLSLNQHPLVIDTQTQTISPSQLREDQECTVPVNPSAKCDTIANEKNGSQQRSPTERTDKQNATCSHLPSMLSTQEGIYPTIIQLFSQLLAAALDPTVRNQRTKPISSPKFSDSEVGLSSPLSLAQIVQLLNCFQTPAVDTHPPNTPIQHHVNNIPTSMSSGVSVADLLAVPKQTCDKLQNTALNFVNPVPTSHLPLEQPSILNSLPTIPGMIPAIHLLNSVYNTTLFCDPNVPVNEQIATSLGRRFTPANLHELPNDRPTTPPQSPQTNVNRPYLCRFCQTRFQALTTFQAHQQYYCQARKETVKNVSNPPANNSVQKITVTQGGGTASSHATSPVPAKRRRVLPGSPSSSGDNHGQHVRQQSSGSLSAIPSSNVSSNSGSGDEAETTRTLNSPTQKSLSRPNEPFVDGKKGPNDADPSGPQWESCGNSELRCSACGYIGQTPRGMKMHRRLHECNGSSVREAKSSSRLQERADYSTQDSEQPDPMIDEQQNISNSKDSSAYCQEDAVKTEPL
ncbi:unnamed protein product [Calicophoron daubneyi]|uniref:C2H2-type domain-containing protein n=1 Tax=Calicophoron daubneyi TaxID=300641 RepID=A0AAV2T346_CALDB